MIAPDMFVGAECSALISDSHGNKKSYIEMTYTCICKLSKSILKTVLQWLNVHIFLCLMKSIILLETSWK